MKQLELSSVFLQNLKTQLIQNHIRGTENDSQRNQVMEAVNNLSQILRIVVFVYQLVIQRSTKTLSRKRPLLCKFLEMKTLHYK